MYRYTHTAQVRKWLRRGTGAVDSLDYTIIRYKKTNSYAATLIRNYGRKLNSEKERKRNNLKTISARCRGKNTRG